MREIQARSNRAKAVVVGLCAHGLALVRALSNDGIPVIAVESNDRMPGIRTKKATVVHMPDVNGAELTTGLLDLANREQFEESPVLFATNDRMVRQIAADWPMLEEYFRLSWGNSTDEVVRYLDKRQIESRCDAVGVLYPRTLVLQDIEQDMSTVRYPAIAKPANPLGAFKAVIVHRESELREVTSQYSASLPFLVQDYVAGPDSSLYVCAMVLDKGDVRIRFDGRKLASFPPGTGQTSVMEFHQNDDVYEIARAFFDGLGINGPVSIEVKKAHDGKYYLIEPTVGRTDYFLDALTSNGTNFPVCEYRIVTGQEFSFSTANDKTVWFDTERDRTCFLRLFRSLLRSGQLRRPVFPYLKWNDLRPFLASIRIAVPAISRSILRRFRPY